MLIGEYGHSIDAKGRIRIPKNFRDDLGEVFYVTKGFDYCLFVFSAEEWKTFMDKVNSNYMKKKEFRKIQRFFTGSAMEISLDSQGRATISPALRAFAGLEKDAVVTGVGKRVEIWSKDRWDDYCGEMDDINDMADNSEDLML